jgi:alpha-glucosidase
MRQLADHNGERLLVGEIYLPNDRLATYHGTAEAPEVHLPFNFQLIEAEWDARHLHDLIAAYEASLPPGAWPNWVMGNHDRPRIATRIGERQARVAAALLLTLRGTPTLYQGDELGMVDVAIPPERVQDPRELREPGLDFGRDPVRTPMVWDAGPNGGFSEAEPWLPLHPDWGSRNVAALAADEGSILSLYRQLLALRRAHPALAIGDMTLLDAQGDVLAYERRHGRERIVIALNLGCNAQPFAPPPGRYRALLGGDDGPLAPDEARILLAQDHP